LEKQNGGFLLFQWEKKFDHSICNLLEKRRKGEEERECSYALSDFAREKRKGRICAYWEYCNGLCERFMGF